MAMLYNRIQGRNLDRLAAFERRHLCRNHYAAGARPARSVLVQLYYALAPRLWWRERQDSGERVPKSNTPAVQDAE